MYETSELDFFCMSLVGGVFGGGNGRFYATILANSNELTHLNHGSNCHDGS